MLTDFMTTVRTLSASTRPGCNLTLDYNPFEDFRHNPRLLTTNREPPSNIQYLSLIGTNTSRVCFSDWKITRLNLSTNNMKELQVQDCGNVTCAGGSLLNDLNQEQLCSILNTVACVWLFPGAAVLMGLLAILGVVYMRYNRQLKVWLYVRGWCLSYVREEELDADRECDAFVSFAHGDYEFVASHLLPGLEDGPHGYKVCVHYRDWVPREMISTQITRSVASSRRTVIVLSANFVQSMWGMVEFRAVHVSALAEGRVRVLVVALEDTPLPEELRLYLRSTTYLRWDDPWFWKKLRYALPHRAGPKNRIIPQEEHVRETTPPPCGFEMALYEKK